MPEDIKLTCVECKKDFDFTVKDQQFFAETFGPDYKQPKRCPRCRKERRERQGAESVAQDNVSEPKRRRTRSA